MIKHIFNFFFKKMKKKSQLIFPYYYENEYGIKFFIKNEIEEYRTKFYGHEKTFVLDLYNKLKNDDVFYDVGSSVGLISMFASKKIKYGKVVSFEPDPQNLNALIENFTINKFGKYIIFPIAIGSEKTKLNLFTNGSNDQSPSLRKVNNIENYIEVEVNSIDNLIEEGLIAPTVIKIDVEGAEFLVLKGMSKLLASENAPRLLIIEIHPEFLLEFDSNEFDIFHLLNSYNYILESKIERDNQILCSYHKKI